MLELKGLTKTYKSKKGVAVRALDDVSLSFEDRGMVFVLGRSGSGKSTLLNVVGGLDSADSGEIIVDGKSSKDFKSRDYDAYRNTYIGFIFQEYNLLDEFTVGENIMLALELQNQKADKERLDSILKEVDLEGYADRRPNELSGGQRQRVAIARALVKNPHIIMADEPTGALDEETGIQVLETLKKMSKDKLVIVISHDREFAEQYGDRIIRLSDGKVKSDTAVDNSSTQTSAAAVHTVGEGAQMSPSRLPYRYALKMGAHSAWTKPFRLIVTIILCMVSFAAFGVVDTANAFDSKKAALNSYLDARYQASAYTAYLMLDSMEDTNGASENDIERLKQKTGLDYVGVATTENNMSGYSLSLLSSAGLSGNNRSQYYTQTVYGYYPANTQLFESMDFTLIGEMPKADNEIVITQYILDQINLGGIDMYTEYIDRDLVEMRAVTILSDASRTARQLVAQGLFIKLGSEYWKIVGVLDTKADSEGKYNSLKPSDNSYSKTDSLLQSECVEYFRYGYHSIAYISQDRYDSIVKSYSADLVGWDVFGIHAQGRLQLANSEGLRETRCWGVASDNDLNKVRDVIWLDGNERAQLEDGECVIGLNAALKFFQETLLIEQNTYYTHDRTYFGGIASFEVMSLDDLYNTTTVSSKYAYAARYIACFDEAESIGIEQLNLFKEYVCEKIDSLSGNPNLMYGNEYYVISRFYNEIKGANKINVQEDLLEYSLDALTEEHWRAMYAGYLLNGSGWRGYIGSTYFDMDSGYYSNVTGRRVGEALERIDAKAIYIMAKLKSRQEQSVVKSSICYACERMYYSKTESGNIVGIYIPNDEFPGDDSYDAFVFSNNQYRALSSFEESPFAFLLAPMPTDSAQLSKLVSVHYEDGDRVLKMHNGVVIAIELVQDPLYSLKVMLIVVGLGLAIFSVMMLGNYIGTSISNKKRDVGILRALGAKTSDVFAIFVNESIIISMFNAVASIVVTIFACIGFNGFIKNAAKVDISVLNFGVRQVVIMLIINVAIAVLASLIPIYRMSKKKPIDCIHDK